jgi:hypothetical protein
MPRVAGQLDFLHTHPLLFLPQAEKNYTIRETADGVYTMVFISL